VNLFKVKAAVPALLGAALVVVPLATPAAAAPQPQVLLGDIPDAALSTTAFGGLDVFHAAPDNTLVHRTADGTAENLGGALITGPAAITIGSEFASTWASAVGTDEALWYRQFSDGRGTWGPWTSAGGRSFEAPAVSCSGDSTAQPILYAVGGDRALWRKSLPGGNWLSLGGLLVFAPGAVPAQAGVCPSDQDVFGIGDNFSVYENRSGHWSKVGGQVVFAPTLLRQPDGRTELYVVGFDNALWTASRAAGSTTWSRFVRIGARLTSSPAAQLWKASATAPTLRVVVGRGGDGRLWRGTNPVGTATWTWHPAP
jgi:hypothetical protein